MSSTFLTTMRPGVVLLSGLFSAALACGEPEVAALRLRSHATVYGAQATLGDVLIFDRGAADLSGTLATEPLLREAPRPAAITHGELLARLGDLNVNLAQVLVCGAARCTIAYEAPVESATDAGAAGAPQDAGRSNSADGVRTLADVLRATLAAELHDMGGTPEVHFERAGQEVLELTTPPWEFGVSAGGHEKLGLREFQVALRRDGRTQRRVTITARVRLVREVVIAERPLSIGNFIRAEDLAVQTRVFDEPADSALTQPAEIIGQQVRKFVAAGDMVTRTAVKAVDLVSRARPVTVLGAGERVQLRLSGVALDNGGFGEVVRIRLGEGRGERRVLRGVVTGMATVKLMEGAPS